MTIGLVLLVFAAIGMRLYNMQVVDAEVYQADAYSRTSKTLTLYGMRGTIYDSAMNPIAYAKRSFNVQFYRDPSRTDDKDRAEYTQAIIDVIKMVESRGKKTISEFWLEKGEDGVWRFNTGTDNAAADAKRQQQWRDNFSVASVAEKDLFDTLCANYAIPKDMPEKEKLKVLAIWQESRMNAFKPEPVTIAYDVNFDTVAEIEVKSMSLPGVSVSESSTRVYPKKSSAAHAIGYISKISGDEQLDAYKEKGYPNDAVVGMTGIEYSMETELTPYTSLRQGKRTVELNNRGKIIRELDYQAPVNGNDVVLTLNMTLQAAGEKAIAKVISGIHKIQEDQMDSAAWKAQNRTELLRYATLDQPVKTAQTGAFVAIDPNSGAVWALGSYPAYDLSMFGSGVVDPDAWREVVQDERNPMYNRAVSTRDTPGSIFKMVTSLGALMESPEIVYRGNSYGNFNLNTKISDMGKFKGTDTVHEPKCWSSEGPYIHTDQTVVEGLKNSCNFFFYTVGLNLGVDNIQKWAAQLGLTSKTNLELPNESTSFVGNQFKLYDPERSINDQYTSKPIFAASMIKRKFRQIGAARGIEYDEERLDIVTKMMLDIVTEDPSIPKDTAWPPKIRNILMNEMNIPSKYIAQHTLVNEFFYLLNDLRWTANETIMTAIGQSITQVTPVAVARYVAAIANNGTVYDLRLIDKVVSPTGQVVLDKKPVVVNKINADEFLSAIRQGMSEVTSMEDGGTAAQYFSKVKGYKIAAKTGTAQRSKIDIENNSWLVTYAPVDDPQIVVVVYVQNGYAGARSANCAIDIIEAYMASKKLKDNETVPSVGQLTF